MGELMNRVFVDAVSRPCIISDNAIRLLLTKTGQLQKKKASQEEFIHRDKDKPDS